MGLKLPISILSYVNEEMEIYSYVTVMIKILGMYLRLWAPRLCILTQMFSNINVLHQFEKCT